MKLTDRDIRKAAGLKMRVPVAVWLWSAVALLLLVNFGVMWLDRPEGPAAQMHGKVLSVARGRLPGQEAVTIELADGHRISYVAHHHVHPGEDVVVDRQRSALFGRTSYTEHR
jgi:hypothetical protein